MVITLDPQLAAAVSEHARRQGVPPEALALNALRDRFLPSATSIQPQDDWERRLLGLVKDCGVSLPDAALSREELYE
jgi:hypothetical protein